MLMVERLRARLSHFAAFDEDDLAATLALEAEPLLLGQEQAAHGTHVACQQLRPAVHVPLSHVHSPSPDRNAAVRERSEKHALRHVQLVARNDALLGRAPGRSSRRIVDELHALPGGVDE